MFLAGLHALGRDRPDLVVEVELLPARADHLAGPGGGQDGELQRQGAEAGLLAQLDPEGRDVGVGQRGVMLPLAVPVAGEGPESPKWASRESCSAPYVLPVHLPVIPFTCL